MDMKQHRASSALDALQEMESLVPFGPDDGWEFHDIMYRNFAWLYSSMDESEKTLEYTRKAVEVKRACGVPATWFDVWDLGKCHARLGQENKQIDEMRIGYELCCKAGQIHRKAEPSDRIMLAKILSNVGEVAMGVGDRHRAAGDAATAEEWYLRAEGPLRESYELHSTSLGPLKPLSGWAAGTVAHCLLRLNRLEETRDYLALSLKVECIKDETTPGSLIELLDRVVHVHQQLGDPQGLAAYADDLQEGLAGLRQHGWDRKEHDVFALLLQRVSTSLLLADHGSGTLVPSALHALHEAESNLQLFVSQAHAKMGDSETQKQFGPQVDDPAKLLQEINSSIRILEIGSIGPS